MSDEANRKSRTRPTRGILPRPHTKLHARNKYTSSADMQIWLFHSVVIDIYQGSVLQAEKFCGVKSRMRKRVQLLPNKISARNRHLRRLLYNGRHILHFCWRNWFAHRCFLSEAQSVDTCFKIRYSSGECLSFTSWLAWNVSYKPMKTVRMRRKER